MSKNILLAFFSLMGAIPSIAQKNYQIQPPNRDIKVEVMTADKVTLVTIQDRSEAMNSATSMTLQGGEVPDANPEVSKMMKISVDKEVPSPFYKKNVIKDIYNEMQIPFRGSYGLVFRVYNDGIAYHFMVKGKGPIVIADEETTYNFPSDYKTFTAYVNSTKPTFEERFFNSFEQPYVNETILSLDDKHLKTLPLSVDLEDGRKICITEADLEDFPGMFLNNETEKPSLKAIHTPYPRMREQGGHNQLQMLVEEREDYIAKTSGARSFPWRTFIISRNDRELADCDMVYCLASPSRVNDISWTKPGKVAWDWWSNWSLYGMDFRIGINNPTYKYCIDFAAGHGIEYVILDEGWAVNLQADTIQVILGIDLQELVDYGKPKNVEIILWAGYWAFARDMENVVKHYSNMGAKGFKVDFSDRDDQEMMNFVYKASEVYTKYKMLVDFHGVFKPADLQRTYPNVLNREGMNGLEQMKRSPEKEFDMMMYDITIPSIRMIAGPMDYTQGTMRNTARDNHWSISSGPISQGTRHRQLATCVIFESPSNMLCDAPSNYRREEEYTEFISNIPTIWGETISLTRKASEYVAIARHHGNDWYIGVLTNWAPRKLDLDLSSLGEGDYALELLRDDMSADRAARDYRKEVTPVSTDRGLKIHMAPGGNHAVRTQKR